MNIYGVIAFIVSIIVFAHVFDAVVPISNLIEGITSIPDHGPISRNPFYPVLIRFAYLIVGLGAFKMILRRRD